ncbi:MAG: TIGR04086 family membrane protein [Bacilli bacterium]
MKYAKNLGFSLLFIIGSLLILTLLLTLFNYFNLFSNGIVSTFKIIIPIISLFAGGFFIGKKSCKQGWLEGLKLSLIFTIILILFNSLGLGNKLELKNILYYLIIIISCMFGGMLGINKNNLEN